MIFWFLFDFFFQKIGFEIMQIVSAWNVKAYSKNKKNITDLSLAEVHVVWRMVNFKLPLIRVMFSLWIENIF